MIKVSVMYPNGAGAKFDMAYYLNTHMPMVETKAGAGAQRHDGRRRPRRRTPGVARGLSRDGPPDVRLGRSVSAPPSPPTAPTIQADIPNYTNTQPTIQISQVKM